MVSGDIHKANSSTLRQKSLIALSDELIAGPIRNNQNLEQSQRGCNEFPVSRVDLFKQRFEQGKKLWMFFDEVDEYSRINSNRAGPEVGYQSHEARSRAMCPEASIPRQYCLPRPLSSRIERRFGVSNALLDDFLSDRPMLASSSRPELLVDTVREVFDIQDGHCRATPPFLHYVGIRCTREKGRIS